MSICCSTFDRQMSMYRVSVSGCMYLRMNAVQISGCNPS